MTTPPSYHGAIRYYECETCGKAFAVCRTDLLRPDILKLGSIETNECPRCFEAAIFEHTDAQAEDLVQTVRESRERMFAFHRQFHAACG